MRKVIILLYALALSDVAFATGQEGDVIYINGEKWFLLAKPIGSDSILRRGVDSILPENRDEVTSNWSGYTAYWSIYNKQLFLDSILVECYSEVAKKDYTVRIPTADMQRVFKDYYKKKNILATWVDYNIRAAKGPILYYINAAGALISPYDFKGVYVMEAISCAFFIIFGIKTTRLFL